LYSVIQQAESNHPSNKLVIWDLVYHIPCLWSRCDFSFPHHTLEQISADAHGQSCLGCRGNDSP